MLKEAQLRGQGLRLGPLGSRIVAEVFIGLLDGHANAYSARNPQWTPFLGSKPGEFTIADLLVFGGHLNPIG